jgi:hypothetical protein
MADPATTQPARQATTAAGRIFLLIAITAAIAVLPLVFLGNPWGHDVDLHIPAWLEAELQLRQGILYPRWAAGAHYGFGEPFFIFYPPLSWMVGGTLGLILPWKMVPGVFVWLVLVLAGTAMWKCASDWLDPADAALASLLYLMNPYLLATFYKRCNYAELVASALIPLLVWAALRMEWGARRTIPPLSIAFAAIWLSDLPAAVIGSYVLATMLLVSSFVKRSLRPLLYGSVAILGGFGSIAVFLLPAAWERRWVNIGEAIRPDWAPENNFLFAHNTISPNLPFNLALSFIAVLLMIVAAIAAALSSRFRRSAPDAWRLLVVLGGLSTFMMFSVSSILWRILPEMRYVEFPWRWLSPLCVVTVLLTSAAVAQARNKRTWRVTVAVAVTAIAAVIVYTVRWDTHHQHLQDLTVAAHSGAGYPGVPWCYPLGSRPSKLPKDAPLIATDREEEKSMSREGAQIHVERWSAEQRVFSVESPRPLALRIKLLPYPAWQGKLDGKAIPLEASQETGQMLLSVPAGASRTEIKFVRTWDRTLGIAVSLTTVLAFILLRLTFRRRETSAGRL